MRALWLIGLIALLLLVPPYLLAPLQVWRRSRTPRVRARLLSPHDAPDEVRASVQALAPRARALGFDLRSAVEVNDGQAVVLHCASAVPEHLLEYRTPTHHWQVFISRFTTGDEVVSTNAPAPPVFSLVPTQHVCALPPDADLETLLRAHRAHVNLSVRAGAAPAATPAGIAFVEEFENRTMETQRRLGLYRYDGEGYRPTLRGAFLVTLRMLPPLRWLRARENARVVERLLSES